ncbi:MAG TPA: sigma-70 family RNA polymerase sigma factor [Tepidisphaeraceae bacterium]|jgi:RNA polymerase sigma-70 factor (ECF subfamily)
MIERPRIEEFVRLFTSHEARLRGFAISLIPNWADAEEVMQQASMAMWTKFAEFQSGTNFFAWASRIVYLEAMRFRQTQARDRVRFSDAFCRAVARIALTVSEDLADREKALSNCLAKLKPAERELIHRRYEDGGSVEALAKAMGRSDDAIYGALRRIRRQLFDCITRTLRAGERYAT